MNMPMLHHQPPRLRARARAALALAAALASAACDRGGATTSAAELWSVPEGVVQPRRIVSERWDTLWSFGGIQDTLLADPNHMVASEAGVFVFDPVRQQLIAFDTAGGLRWVYGGRGAGPDELHNVRDVSLGARGDVYLLDPGNTKAVRLAPDGTVAHRYRLAAVGQHYEAMIPLEDGRLVLFTLRRDSSVATVDTAGRVLSWREFPWREFAGLHPLQRQGQTVGSGGRWGYFFTMGDGWFPFDGTEPAGQPGRYVEHVDFPGVRVDVGPGSRTTRLQGYHACTGCSLAVSGSTLSVVFGGKSARARRLVDQYRWPGGEYLGTRLLPARTALLAVHGDVYYVIFHDPAPRLYALRPR